MRLSDLVGRLPKQLTGDTDADLRGLIKALTDILRAASDLPGQSFSHWTPLLIGSGTAGTQTYSNNSGFYVRTGNLVYIEGEIVLTAKGGTIAGNTRISGLPFVVSASSQGPGMSLGYYRNVNLSAGYSQVVLQAVPNTQQLALRECGDNVAEAAVAVGAIAADSALAFGGFFFVD